MKKISDFNSATEKYPVVYAGSATRPEYVDMPTILQQQEGVAPLDTCPAQWWNAMWKLATKDINAFRDYVGDAFTEINNLLTKFGITLDDADSEQLYDFFHDDYVQNYLTTVLSAVFVNKSGDTVDGDLHIKGDLTVDGIGEEVISTELKVGANTITLRNGNPSALGNTELAGVVTENYDGNNHNNIIAIRKNGEARTGDIDIATRILYSNDGTNFYTDEDLTTPATIGTTEEVRDTGNQTSGGVEIYEGITYSNDDTQPLLTRAESNAITNGHYLKWDAVNKRAVDGGGAIDMFFPIGSIYWTGKAPNDGGDPNVLFGGTWVQIKDRFVLAAGDTYTAGSTGGSATVTLTSAQMPVHTHTMESAGSHSHTTNTLTNSSGTAITTTGNQSANPSFAGSHTHHHLLYVYSGGKSAIGNVYGYTLTASNIGSSSGANYAEYPTYQPGTDNKNYISDTTVTIAGTTTGNHNHNFEHKHGTDSQGLHTHTINNAGGTNGTTQAHNNMPPYVVKYCWERTA